MRARPLALAALTVTLVALLSACGSDHSAPPSAAISGSSGRAADIAFAQLMIPHHRQAIEMADLAPTRASSPQVKALAAQIKAAQDPEIAQMTVWLKSWGAPSAMPGSDSSGMPGDDHSSMDMGGVPVSGMMSAQTMDELEAATGQEFDRLWQQYMIGHHRGAIEMANQVLKASQDDAVKKLAQQIITAQQAEIDTMTANFEGSH